MHNNMEGWITSFQRFCFVKGCNFLSSNDLFSTSYDFHSLCWSLSSRSHFGRFCNRKKYKLVWHMRNCLKGKLNTKPTLRCWTIWTVCLSKDVNLKGKFILKNKLKGANITNFQVIVLYKCLPSFYKFKSWSCIGYPDSVSCRPNIPVQHSKINISSLLDQIQVSLNKLLGKILASKRKGKCYRVSELTDTI